MKIQTIALAGLLFALFISAGCTDLNSNPAQSEEGKVMSSDNYSEGLTYTATEPVQHYRSGGSCYRVADVNIMNKGATDAQNVVVRCNLIDPSTNSVSDTMSKYYEVIDSGDHKAFTVELDGTCGTTYELEVVIQSVKLFF